MTTPSTADASRPALVLVHGAWLGAWTCGKGAADLANVRHVVYVCGFALDVDESLIQLSGKVPWWNIDGDTMTTHDTHEILFTDVPLDELDRAIALMKPFTHAAVTQPLLSAPLAATELIVEAAERS